MGINSLDDSLKQNGFSDSFADVFGQWSIANVLNDTSANAKFGYTRDGLRDFHVAPTKVFNNISDNITFAASDDIKDWQERWYDVSQFTLGQKHILKIKFSSPSLESFYVPYLVFKSDGSQVLSVFRPSTKSDTLYILDIGQGVGRVLFMPIKTDKVSGFTASETAIPLTFTIERTDTFPQEVLTPFVTSSPLPSPTPLINATNFPLYGIPDGSLIRADGDYKYLCSQRPLASAYYQLQDFQFLLPVRFC